MTRESRAAELRRTRRTQREVSRDIDLGLAVLSVITPPGVWRSQEEIAYCCNCTHSAIWLLEKKALRKLKKRLFMRNDPELRELVESAIFRR